MSEDLGVPSFDNGADEDVAGELIEQSFAVVTPEGEPVTVRVRINRIEEGVAALYDDVPVWVCRDQVLKAAPSAYVGFEGPQRILLLNAARLDSEKGIARIFLQLATPEIGVDLAEGKRIVERACEAAGIQQAKVQVRNEILQLAAKIAYDTRESTKQKALAAARTAMRAVFQLAEAPAVPPPAPSASPSADASAPPPASLARLSCPRSPSPG